MAPQGNMGPSPASDWVFGHLSQTMGNLGPAATHFEDSLSFCRKAGPITRWTSPWPSPAIWACGP